jgi:hypothetical protein
VFSVVEIGGDGADERFGQPWVTACIGLLSSLFSSFSRLHSVNMGVLLLKPSREEVRSLCCWVSAEALGTMAVAERNGCRRV